MIVVLVSHRAIDWERVYGESGLVVDAVDSSRGRVVHERGVLRLGAGWAPGRGNPTPPPPRDLVERGRPAGRRGSRRRTPIHGERRRQGDRATRRPAIEVAEGAAVRAGAREEGRAPGPDRGKNATRPVVGLARAVRARKRLHVSANARSAAFRTRLTATLAPSPHRRGPRVSALVLTRDGLAHLQRLLPALEALAYEDLELVVVDNASSDGSAEFLARRRRGSRSG